MLESRWDLLIIVGAIDVVIMIGLFAFPQTYTVLDQTFGVQYEYNDEKLIFSEDQIDKMNKDYENHLEVGWCFESSGDYVTNFRQGELDNQTRGSVVVGCGRGFGEIHTHPRKYISDFELITTAGNPLMSKQDKESFRAERKDFNRRIKCIYSGQLVLEDNPLSLNCYDLESDGSFSRVDIVVEQRP